MAVKRLLSINQDYIDKGVDDILTEWQHCSADGFASKVCEAILAYYRQEQANELPDSTTVAQLLKRDNILSKDYAELPSVNIDAMLKELKKKEVANVPEKSLEELLMS